MYSWYIWVGVCRKLTNSANNTLVGFSAAFFSRRVVVRVVSSNNTNWDTGAVICGVWGEPDLAFQIVWQDYEQNKIDSCQRQPHHRCGSMRNGYRWTTRLYPWSWPLRGRKWYVGTWLPLRHWWRRKIIINIKTEGERNRIWGGWRIIGILNETCVEAGVVGVIIKTHRP